MFGALHYYFVRILEPGFRVPVRSCAKDAAGISGVKISKLGKHKVLFFIFM
jgi:hypothetical protein